MPESFPPNGSAEMDPNSASHPTDSTTSISTSAQSIPSTQSPSLTQHQHQQPHQRPEEKETDKETPSTAKHPTTSTLRLSLPTIIAHCHHQVHAFLSESHPPNTLLATTQHQTRASLAIIKDALARYQLPELSLSYNGGKDCLVLLILFLASLHPHPPAAAGGLASIPAIYALPPDPFPDVEDFVRWSSEAYHLSIDKFTTDPPSSTLRDAFDHYLALNPTIRAIFVGTRRTDPHGANLTHFDPTDSGWPDFVRIHPVIDWHYAQIWAFIRHLDLRYCPLYDQGYTSLGGTTDTLPNPKLRTDGPDGEDEYRPAYELTEDLEERLGRN